MLDLFIVFPFAHIISMRDPSSRWMLLLQAGSSWLKQVADVFIVNLQVAAGHLRVQKHPPVKVDP